jgi:hypothetical protein
LGLTAVSDNAVDANTVRQLLTQYADAVVEQHQRIQRVNTFVRRTARVRRLAVEMEIEMIVGKRRAGQAGFACRVHHQRHINIIQKTMLNKAGFHVAVRAAFTAQSALFRRGAEHHHFTAGLIQHLT